MDIKYFLFLIFCNSDISFFELFDFNAIRIFGFQNISIIEVFIPQNGIFPEFVGFQG